jgi:heme-degrading monooxygenase HmoA
MIARMWTARARPEQAPRYRKHFEENVLPGLRSLPGFREAKLLADEQAQQTEFVVLTFWDSMEAVRSFAGADAEGAVVAREAAALLEDYDRRVRHYTVL